MANCVTTSTPESALDRLQKQLPRLLSAPIDSETVIETAARFATQLQTRSLDLPLDDDQRQGLIEFCQRSNLSTKLERELGAQPRSLRRIDYRQPYFESWHPLGLVVHVTPGNAPMLAFCAVLESLLAGNINWLRPSASDEGLTAQLLAALVQCDTSGRLAEFVAVLPVGTSRIANSALRPMACQPGAVKRRSKRFVSRSRPDVAGSIGGTGSVSLICRLTRRILRRWMRWWMRFAVWISKRVPARNGCWWTATIRPSCRTWASVWPMPSNVARHTGRRWCRRTRKRAEITTRTAMAQLDQCFANQTGQVWTGHGWRVIWEHHQTLAPSPLFRTVLLKPVPQHLIAETLLPWRTVLQSCALICSPAETPGLVRTLVNAGVTRIAPCAAIHDGYAGEPHDGVYALSRLSRRLSVSLSPDVLPGRATLDPVPPAPDTAHDSDHGQKRLHDPADRRRGAVVFPLRRKQRHSGPGRFQLSRLSTADARRG